MSGGEYGSVSEEAASELHDLVDAQGLHADKCARNGKGYLAGRVDACLDFSAHVRDL
jgi:hypothetical protein